MKKILIAQEIYKILQRKNNFLNRADMMIFTAASHDEVLEIHRAERVDLIITQLDLPGITCEQFCSRIREDANLREVSIIMVCANNNSAKAQSARCRANAVVLRPFKSDVLLAKAKELLNISWRETYRVLLSVAVEGNANNQMFFCRSLDISATGMLIETEQVFSPGDRLVCNFFLPDATRIEATGEIVRTLEKAPGTDANRYGVHFLTLAPEAKKTLEAFIDAKASKTTAGAS